MKRSNGYALAAIGLLWGAVAAAAGPCEAYYTFDGTLADSSGNGYDGEMLDEASEPAKAIFTQGKFGQALELDGKAAMRALLDLSYEGCPKVTFSAWIRVDRNAPADTMHVLSTGRGSGPGLRISGRMLALNGTENGLAQWDAIRPGGWLFVAGVYDYDAGTYTLYWQGRHATESLSRYRDAPDTALWVGVWFDDYGGLARGVAIDDLRITGAAEPPERIAALRSARQPLAWVAANTPIPGDPAQLPGDQYTPTQLPGDQYTPAQLPGDQYTRTRLPGDQYEPTELPGDQYTPTLLAGDQYDLAQLDTAVGSTVRGGGIDYQPPPDLIATTTSSGSTDRSNVTLDYEAAPDLLQSGGSGTEPDATAEPQPAQQRASQVPQDSSTEPAPTGAASLSGVTGYAGDIKQPIDLENRFLRGIVWEEMENRPCRIRIYGFKPAANQQERELVDTSLSLNDCLFSSLAGDVGDSDHSTWATGLYAVGRLQVCNNTNANKRLKGIRIWSDALNEDGSPTVITTADSSSLPNCDTWAPSVLCPIGQEATGLVVHARDEGGPHSSKSITGLQLICRAVTTGEAQ
jgi:hypothetical protein